MAIGQRLAEGDLHIWGGSARRSLDLNLVGAFQSGPRNILRALGSVRSTRSRRPSRCRILMSVCIRRRADAGRLAMR